MGYSAQKITDKLIGVIVFIALVVGFAPTVLVYFGNISTSGVVLASVITVIAGILFGIFILKGIMAHLK